MNTRVGYENRSVMKLNEHWARGAVAWLLLVPVAAWPGGVVTDCTEPALRAAMAGGGVVTFACGGTITLASTITNAADIVVDGTGHQVTISGGHAVRVFYVNTNVSFTVLNLTIADAKSFGGSAILNLGGSVNLAGVTLRSTTATISVSNDTLSPKAGGGAIFNRGGTVNATNCAFLGNAAQTPGSSGTNLEIQVYGGAIRNEAGLVVLPSCAFLGNRASVEMWFLSQPQQPVTQVLAVPSTTAAR